jgi:hypothetical protein
VARSALGDRQRPAARPQLAAERQLPEDRPAVERLGRDLAVGREDPHGDREVEARAGLAQVGGREVRGDALLRELEAGVLDRRADALARLADRLVAEPDDREGRQALAQVDLDGHPPRLDAVDREGGDAGEHGSERPFEVVEGDEVARGVDGHPDRVEAQLLRARPVRDLREVRGGHPPHLAALALVQVVPRPPGATARLDLDEDERLGVERDEVDLPVARAVVARDDAEPEALQVLRGEVLGSAAEAVARVGEGHAGDAKDGRVPCLAPFVKKDASSCARRRAG